MKKIFLIPLFLLYQLLLYGQSASTAYIVDEGFTGAGTAVNAGFTISVGGSYTGGGDFGRNSPSLKFSATGDYIEYDWHVAGTVADHISFVCGGLSGAGSTFDVQESSNGTTWTTVSGSPATVSTTASTFDAPLLATSRYVKVTFTLGATTAYFDDFRVRKAGVAPVTSMNLEYELINSHSGGTACGNCEGYNEFVVLETGSDPLDIHYFELVNPTMVYGAGDLAMGGNGTVGTGNNNNTNINWILNGNLTATQTNYTASLNTACGCTAFVNIPASNIIPANSKVIAFTGSAPDGAYTITGLAGKTVYVIYSDDASGCTTSGKYGNTCASNCTRYLTVFNHTDGDISNKHFTTPASTVAGDMWDFSTGALISLGCSLTILPIDLLSFNAAYNSYGNVVDLNWSTASETDNKLFTVQKSTDGKDWSDVISVPGAGNSTENHYYDAVDENPTEGITYYRLMQTDNNGMYKFSNPITINVAIQTKNIVLAPSPAGNYTEVTFNSPLQGNAILSVYDWTGKLLENEQVNMSSKTTSARLNLSNYSNGMYFVVVDNIQEQYTSKLIVNQ
jgi:hypothetical protein